MKLIRALLTLIAVLLAVIAIELAPRPRQTPPPPKLTFDPVEAKLDQHIPRFKLDKVPVKQAIEALRKQTGLEIAIDWASMNMSPTEIDQWNVTLDLRDVPAWVPIELIFDRTWGSRFLHFNVTRGVVIVGEGNIFNPEVLKLAIYDVRDLLSDDYWGVPTPSGQLQSILDARGSALAQVVTSIGSVDNLPMRSQSSGGAEPYGFASINCYAGRLFVTDTSYGQRRIAQTLAYLRGLKEMPRR